MASAPAALDHWCHDLVASARQEMGLGRYPQETELRGAAVRFCIDHILAQWYLHYAKPYISEMGSSNVHTAALLFFVLCTLTKTIQLTFKNLTFLVNYRCYLGGAHLYFKS